MPDPLPLGLVRESGNAKLNRHLMVLERYEFTQFPRTDAQLERWSHTRRATVETALKQFFALAFLDPGHFHTPSLDVDRVWHSMILQTPWYCKFCSRLFRGYFHHFLEPNRALCRARRERTVLATEYWFGDEARTSLKFAAACGNNGRLDRSANLTDLLPPKQLRLHRSDKMLWLQATVVVTFDRRSATR